MKARCHITLPMFHGKQYYIFRPHISDSNQARFGIHHYCVFFQGKAERKVGCFPIAGSGKEWRDRTQISGVQDFDTCVEKCVMLKNEVHPAINGISMDQSRMCSCLHGMRTLVEDQSSVYKTCFITMKGKERGHIMGFDI